MTTHSERKSARASAGGGSVDSYFPALVGGAIGTFLNAMLYLVAVGNGVDMTGRIGSSGSGISISLASVLIVSFLPALPAQAVYFAFGKWSPRPAREFMLAALVVWTLSLIGPAMMANVSVTAAIIAAVMHTVAAMSISAAVLGRIRMHLRAEVQ